jgi:hypothetical protein
VIRSFLQLLRTTPDLPRLGLFVVAALAAFGIGFVAVSPVVAEKLIKSGGYYYILTLVVLFLAFAWRVVRPREVVWQGWLRRPGWPALAIGVAAAFVIWCDPFKHKILFDEYVLQGTAFQMHATKEVGTIVRAYELNGSWQSMDMFLDKRPYFFAFLVSLLHDFTGYRLTNIFLVNATLAPVFLGLFYWLARTVVDRGPALLAVALMATMPLLGQQASGAGMEMHNLSMLALVMVLAVLYLRAPDPDRLSLLVLGALLLSQSRYESVIFVGPVALVIVAGWWRAGRIFIPWIAVVAPLLLVPYAWHKRVVDATPMLWQLNEGQSARFGLQYLAGNFEGAWKFLFNFGPNRANSWYRSRLGGFGLGGALVVGARWLRGPARAALSPATLVLLIFGAGILGDLLLLKFFYYWGRLDDVVASRLALPVCLLFALLAAACVQACERPRWPLTRIVAGGLGVWLLGWGLPAIARHTYTSANLVMQEVEWEHEQLLQRPGPVLYISNKSSIPFLLWHIPSLNSPVARFRGEQIKFHLREGTLREVIVSQALRPTSANGDFGIDPHDEMPAHFRLEPFAAKRFGGRVIRLSRLVAVDPPASPPQQKAGGPEGPRTGQVEAPPQSSGPPVLGPSVPLLGKVAAP